MQTVQYPIWPLDYIIYKLNRDYHLNKNVLHISLLFKHLNNNKPIIIILPQTNQKHLAVLTHYAFILHW